MTRKKQNNTTQTISLWYESPHMIKKNQQQQISVESFYTTKVSTKEIGMWILSVRIN